MTYDTEAGRQLLLFFTRLLSMDMNRKRSRFGVAKVKCQFININKLAKRAFIMMEKNSYFCKLNNNRNEGAKQFHIIFLNIADFEGNFLDLPGFPPGITLLQCTPHPYSNWILLLNPLVWLFLNVCGKKPKEVKKKLECMFWKISICTCVDLRNLASS